MKDTIKAIGLFVVGLTVAAIVYPVMHELAHSLVAIAVGARVVEINILPVSFVQIIQECRITCFTEMVANSAQGKIHFCKAIGSRFFFLTVNIDSWFLGCSYDTYYGENSLFENAHHHFDVLQTPSSRG